MCAPLGALPGLIINFTHGGRFEEFAKSERYFLCSDEYAYSRISSNDVPLLQCVSVKSLYRFFSEYIDVLR